MDEKCFFKGCVSKRRQVTEVHVLLLKVDVPVILILSRMMQPYWVQCSRTGETEVDREQESLLT